MTEDAALDPALWGEHDPLKDAWAVAARWKASYEELRDDPMWAAYLEQAATLARVAALCDGWEQNGNPVMAAALAGQLRAALGPGASAAAQ